MDSLSGAYASNLENNILEKPPVLWVHGHTHFNVDYMIGDTRVLGHMRGYRHGKKDSGYRDDFVPKIVEV